MQYGTGNEDKEHFNLHWPYFDLMLADLFGQLADVPGLDFKSMDSKDLCELLLYGNSDWNAAENRMTTEATISFIERSQSFCWPLLSSNFIAVTSLYISSPFYVAFFFLCVYCFV